MSFSDYTQDYGDFDSTAFAEFQENAKDDTVSAKLEPGEVMVHPEVLENTPELYQIIANAQRRIGQDPNSAIAGMPASQGGQYSPYDYANNPQHFFVHKKIWKAIKKIARNPIVRTALVIGASLTPMGPWLAPVVSGVLTKASGGSWGQALLSAGGAYLGGQVGNTDVLSATGQVTTTGATIGTELAKSAGGSGWGSGISGSIQTGLSNLGVLGSKIADANIGSIIGYNVGEALGGAVGGAIDPPKPVYEEATAYGTPLPPPVASQLPVANRNLNLPLYPNSNIGPINNAPIQGGWNLPSGAQTYGSDVGRGGWANEIPGVTYLQSYKNRDGTREDREVGTFGSMLDRENRRFGLGGGGAGGGVGVSYY
jgi:hypothetical protein